MAKNVLSISINGDTSNLDKALNQARQSLESTAKSADKMNDITSTFERISNSTAPLKRKLRDLQALMAQMNIDGLTDTDVFARMAEEAGSYADALGDARTAVNAFANDNMKLEAMAQGFQLITGSASVLTGALAMCGVHSEKLEEAMLKVQSAIALVNGVTAIANVLNKDSALMLRLKAIRLAANTANTTANTTAETANTVSTTANTTAKVANATTSAVISTATTANTVATAANTVSTVANTTARNAWNMAVAVGKALFGDFTGLVLVGAAALTTYALCTDNSTTALKNNANAVQYSSNVIKVYSSDLSSTMKNNVQRVKALRAEFGKLRTDGEKVEWLREHKKELDNLGVSVNDFINLNEKFKNSNSSVISSMEERARTAVALKKAEAEYHTELAKKSAELITNYQQLKDQWVRLKNTAERVQWINANQTAFEGLGLSVHSVIDAENAFVKNTDKTVEAIQARCKMLASFAQIQRNYDEAERRRAQVNNSVEGGSHYIPVKAGDSVSLEEMNSIIKADKSYDPNVKHYYKQGNKAVLTEAGAAFVNRNRNQRALSTNAAKNKEIDDWLESANKPLFDKLEKMRASLVPENHTKTTTTPTHKPTPSHEDEKIDYLTAEDDGTEGFLLNRIKARDEIKKNTNKSETATEEDKRKIEEINKLNADDLFEAKLRSMFDKGFVDSDTANQLREAKKLKDDLTEKIKITTDEEELEKLEQDLEKANYQYDLLNNKVKSKIDNGDDLVKKATEDLKTATKYREKALRQGNDNAYEYFREQERGLRKKLQEMEHYPHSVKGCLHDIQREIEESNIDLADAIFRHDPDKIKKANDELFYWNEQLHNEKIRMGLEKDDRLRRKRWDIQRRKENALADFEDVRINYKFGLIGYDEAKSKIDEIKAALIEIGEKPIEVKIKDNGTIETKVEQMERLGNTFGYIGEYANQIGSALNAFGENTDIAKAALIAQAIGQLTLSFAGAMKGTFTPWDWIAGAVSGIAVLTSTVAQMQKFEKGGIVQGATYTGDKILARVNAGEGVLTRRGVQNLHNLYENAGIGYRADNTLRGEVDFKISGSSLKGCLKNYESKMGRIK